MLLFGRSIGSGSVCHLAAEQSSSGTFPVAGVVLQSAFTSVIACVLGSRLVSALRSANIFVNIHAATRISVPTLLIHGRQDEVVPFEHALVLQKALPSALSPLHLDAGHNDVEALFQAEMLAAIKKLVDLVT